MIKQEKKIGYNFFVSVLPYNDEFIDFMKQLSCKTFRFYENTLELSSLNRHFRLFWLTAMYRHEIYDSISCTKSLGHPSDFIKFPKKSILLYNTRFFVGILLKNLRQLPQDFSKKGKKIKFNDMLRMTMLFFSYQL